MELKAAINLSLDIFKDFLNKIGIDGLDYIYSSGFPYVFYLPLSDVKNDDDIEFGAFYEPIDIFSMSSNELDNSKLELIQLIKKYNFDEEAIKKISKYGLITLDSRCKENQKKLLKTIIHEYIHFRRSLLSCNVLQLEDKIDDSLNVGDRNNFIFSNIVQYYDVQSIYDESIVELTTNVCVRVYDNDMDIFSAVNDIKCRIESAIQFYGDIGVINETMLRFCNLILENKSFKLFYQMLYSFEYDISDVLDEKVDSYKKK